VKICQQCGACCACFRVSFYWAEAPAQGLPDAYVERLNAHLASMAGTNRPAPRCHALAGEIGAQVSCVVYPQRPSPCRELQPGDEKCNQARARHGLQPLAASESESAVS
jgi:Fe-S-cluster containining protein